MESSAENEKFSFEKVTERAVELLNSNPTCVSAPMARSTIVDRTMRRSSFTPSHRVMATLARTLSRISRDASRLPDEAVHWMGSEKTGVGGRMIWKRSNITLVGAPLCDGSRERVNVPPVTLQSLNVSELEGAAFNTVSPVEKIRSAWEAVKSSARVGLPTKTQSTSATLTKVVDRRIFSVCVEKRLMLIFRKTNNK